MTITYRHMLNQHMKILRGLQYKSGLFAASKMNVSTGYDKAWLRDNFYECLAFEKIGDWETVRKTYRAVLDIFKKHEYKIDYAIDKKPQFRYEYIHARYHPETFDEFWEEWGNKQNDAIGAILYKIGVLEHVRGVHILEDDDDVRVVQKLVNYLGSIEYWHDPDSGMWEEDEEIHSSSVGACVAGLQMIKKHTQIKVPDALIKKGEATLRKQLPRESSRKFVDLALLSLIWPYRVVNQKECEQILKNVEYHLVKHMGVIRYKNDHYYNKNTDGFSEEAEWTFGFSWLAIIYEMKGDMEKAKYYVKLAKKTITKEHEIPELYFSNSTNPNENSPLGWSESLFLVALYKLNKKHLNV
ncbi:glycoside hydrolase family 15 [Candidatus Woesearchaeota archaeon]|nr:glycoside hydrolase family 15 [Candidatus Woesearchaeota archaeon]